MRRLTEISADLARDLEGARETRAVLHEHELEGTCRSRGLIVNLRDKLPSKVGWCVTVPMPELFPVLLLARRIRPGEQPVIRRGGILPLEFGDAEFEAHHFVEGVPRVAAKAVASRKMRQAVIALAPHGRLTIAGNKVEVAASGEPYDVEDVRRGIELALLVAERLDKHRDKRAMAPLDSQELADERAEVERLRALQESFWIRATWADRFKLSAIVGGAIGLVVWIVWALSGR